MPKTAAEGPRPPKISWRAVDGILLFDKPVGISSNQALQRVRRLFRAQKAGHTGSLDPLASGVLPICFGEATKLSGLLLDSDKAYRATVAVGARTSTGDAEGEIVERSEGFLTHAQLEAVLPAFRGPITQIPPMYSALKHQGRPLYEMAREGIEIERTPRQVVIHELHVEQFAADSFELFVRCSKGTYIRTLAEDLARAAAQCAYLAALRRVEVAPFAGLPVHEWDTLAATPGDALDHLLLPPAAALRGWTELRVDTGQARRLAQGQRLAAPLGVSGPVAVLDGEGQLLGIADCSEGRLAPRRWLAGT